MAPTHGPYSLAPPGVSRVWGSWFWLLHDQESSGPLFLGRTSSSARKPLAFLDGSIFLDFLEKGIAVGTWAPAKTSGDPFLTGVAALVRDSRCRGLLPWADAWDPYLGQDSLLSWVPGDEISCLIIMGWFLLRRQRGMHSCLLRPGVCHPEPQMRLQANDKWINKMFVQWNIVQP